jgi:hypothetical protein
MKGEVSDFKSDLSGMKQLLMALSSPSSTMATIVSTEPSELMTGAVGTYGSTGVG